MFWTGQLWVRNYFCILLYQCIYNLFEDNIHIFWYNKNYNCYQRKRNTCMNNFPLLSLMCSCLTNMVFLLWTGGNLQFFLLVCLYFPYQLLLAIAVSGIHYFPQDILGCEVRRKSKSNPITPNMLPSPHCLREFLDASWSRQYKALSSTSKPPETGLHPLLQKKKKPYKTMSSRSDPRFTSFHTLITFLSCEIHSVLNTV